MKVRNKKSTRAPLFFLTAFLILPVVCAAAGLEAVEKRNALYAGAAETKDDEKAIAELKASGVLSKALGAGARAPDFTLPNTVGEPVHLYKMLKRGPVVLVWYQGGWSMHCTRYLEALQTIVPELRKTGAELVAVSPEMPNKAFATRENGKLRFELLSDIGSEAAQKFGIAYDLPGYLAEYYRKRVDLKEYNGRKNNTLPLTAVYVIDSRAVITYAFLDEDYRRRPDPAALLDEIKKSRLPQNLPRPQQQ